MTTAVPVRAPFRVPAAPSDPVGDAAATCHHFLPALTGVRALAALWVVSYHLTPQVQALFPGLPFALYSAVAGLGYLGVDVFFILSGFILALNYAARLRDGGPGEVPRFLWARFSRVYPVHLFALLLLVPASVALSHLHASVEPGRFSASGFVANLFLVQAWRLDTIPHLNWNTPSWSVSCEWLAYLLFPLLAPLVWRSFGAARFGRLEVGRGVRSVLAALALLVAVPTLLYLTGALWHSGIADHLIRVLAEFVAGTLLYRAFAAGLGAGRDWNRISLVSLLLLAVGGLLVERAGYGNYAYVLVPCFAPLLYALAQQRGAWARLLSTPAAVYWGAASYSLYMTHNLWLMAAKAALPAAHFTHSGLPVRLAVLLVTVLPLLVIAALTFRLVEEPSRRFLNRLALPRRAAPVVFGGADD